MNINQKITQIETENTFEVMTKEDFISFMENINNGSHTYGSIITLAKARMNVKGNPFRDRVMKLAKWNFGCNTSFGKKGDNLREKSGIEGEFKPKSTYVETDVYDENFVVCHKKDDPNTKYLRLYTNANSNTVTFTEYYIDDVKATEFEMEQLRTFIKKSVKGSHNLGVKGAEAFGTFNVGLDSVKYIFVNGRKIKIV